MNKPTIFCSKKEASVDEKVTLVAHSYNNNNSIKNRWQFLNVSSKYITLIGSNIYDSEITFTCSRAIEPLTIQYNNPNNPIYNSVNWDLNTSGDLKDWTLSGTGSGYVKQTDGYLNFDGKYYQVKNGDSNGITSLMQSLTGVDAGLYNIKLKYKSTNPLKINIDASNSITLPPTDKLYPSTIYPILHDGGVFKFLVVNNASSIEFLFFDGAVNSNIGEHNVIDGITYLTTDDFTGMELTLTGGCSITSDLSDIPEGLNNLNLADNNISGDISKVASVKKELILSNNNLIQGNINTLRGLELSTVMLNGTTVEGSVYLDLDDKDVYTGKLFNWNLDDTIIGYGDLAKTIEYITGYNITHNILSGEFICNAHSIVDEATYKNVKLLREQGWSMVVSMPTNNGWDTTFAATSADMITYYLDLFWDTI